MRNCLFLLFFLLHFSFLSAETKYRSPKALLQNKIPKKNMRYDTFHAALKLMRDRNMKTIVETGTARGGRKGFESDGGSTIIFADWAKERGAEFYSVDISLDHLNQAKRGVTQEIGAIPSSIHFVCSDSIAFLQNFGKTIDFLYLDSYDFDFNNPLPSQYHHLYEIQAAYPKLSENSIVMIDDCTLPYGGKGKFAIEFLLERGWKILENRYQVILYFK